MPAPPQHPRRALPQVQHLQGRNVGGFVSRRRFTVCTGSPGGWRNYQAVAALRDTLLFEEARIIPPRRGDVTIRCILDGLLLPAVVRPARVPPLVAFEGDESFPVEAVEALYYEMVSATGEEVR